MPSQSPLPCRRRKPRPARRVPRKQRRKRPLPRRRLLPRQKRNSRRVSPPATITMVSRSSPKSIRMKRRSKPRSGLEFSPGHVRVFDPRFNLQSDKLTVFIHKEEGEGLEKAIAEGNVGVVRDKPDPKGGPPSKAVGLSDKAVYTSSDGNVELTGSPRVQMNLDSHVATSPDTVMILNQNGHLTTHGPSRTEIRQENANGKPGQPEKPGQPTPTPSPGASASASATPSPAASPEKNP